MTTALLLAVACGENAGESVTVRDSARVRIVESRVPVGLPFSLDTVPAFDIGPAAGAESEFISHPVSAVRLPDHRIAAAGWAMTEVKVFDSLGRWVRSVGRSGGGPGEFEALGFVYQGAGDSVLTFEPGTQRLQRWTSALEPVDLALVVSTGDQPAVWAMGSFDDGSLLLVGTRPGAPAPGDPVERQRKVLFRRRGNGAWDSLVSFATPPQVRDPRFPGSMLGNALFSPNPSYHARHGRLAFSSGERFEIAIRGADGMLQSIVRRASEPRTVTGEERRRALDAWAERMPVAVQEDMKPVMLAASSSRIRPPVSQVWLAGDGRLWATYGNPDIGEPVRASVFDPEGRWEGDLELPPGLTVNQIDGDGILGTFIDDDGFSHLRFYRLVPTR
ncbi:MAG: hypothetical protein AB7L66_10405 [Gemmatimonadales bacterium]